MTDDVTPLRPDSPSRGADLRARGEAKMAEVYGFPPLGEAPGPYVAYTVEHLFGDVWSREALGVRDRRVLTIGVLAALGRADLLGIQFGAALERGELTPEQLREVVLHLAHYVGWPLSTGANQAAEEAIARHERSGGGAGGAG